MTCCLRFGMMSRLGVKGEAVFEPLNHGMNSGLQFGVHHHLLDCLCILKIGFDGGVGDKREAGRQPFLAVRKPPQSG